METINVCTKCGKMWDSEGRAIIMYGDSMYEIENFVCESCRRPNTID